MKRLNILVIPFITSWIVSCGNRHAQTAPDMQYLRDIGYEYATRYNAIRAKSPEMTCQDFLLDVRSREKELRDSIGDEYADIFITAFSDSASISKQPR